MHLRLFKRDRSSNGSRTLRLSEDGLRLGARLRTSFERSVLFTGTEHRDGVTTVATQVAMALAQMNEGAVILIDANLRQPGLHRFFDADEAPGLSELIGGKATLETAVRVSDIPSLSYMTAGTPFEDPVNLLTSAAYAETMQELRRAYRFVILDSAPILKFADAAVLAPRVDGVVLVAATGQRQRSDIKDVRQTLEGLGANFIGVVLS